MIDSTDYILERYRVNQTETDKINEFENLLKETFYCLLSKNYRTKSGNFISEYFLYPIIGKYEVLSYRKTGADN